MIDAEMCLLENCASDMMKSGRRVMCIMRRVFAACASIRLGWCTDNLDIFIFSCTSECVSIYFSRRINSCMRVSNVSVAQLFAAPPQNL